MHCPLNMKEALTRTRSHEKIGDCEQSKTEMTDFSTLSYTVFIAISAQPRISAHLEKAPILKVEIVIKPPAPNKRPSPPPPPPNQNKRPPPPHLLE